ncbi:MAG TPA: PKD domain-containing protein, partial [Cytophagaceae bacterium]
SSLSQIRWSTYLGGTGIDALYSLAFDSKDNIYVTGGTTSSDLVTTTTAISPVYKGNIDAFVSKLSPEGKSILASTYFGSEEYDQSYFVELDFRDNVHLFGQTKAPGTTLVKNAAYSVPNSGQFICKMNESLDTLKWSTVFGNGIAEPNISPTAFLVDVCSKIYISGWGGSPKHGDLTREIKHDFTMPITKDAFFPVSKDSNDFYMMTLAFDASEVVFGSYFGGGFASEHVDGGTSRFDRKGKIYQSVCAGCGGYSDFPIKPLPGAVSERNRSRNCNNAVFKISFQMPAVIADFTTDSCQPLKFINTSLIQKDTKYDWDFGDGGKSKERSPSHTYKTPGTYRVKLFVSDYLTCNLEDSLVKSVYVSPLINDITIAASQLSFCEPETLQLFVSPSLPTLRYSWSPAEKVSNPSIANPSFYIDTTTTFTVTVTDPASSCVRTKQIEIKSSFAVKSGFQATGCTPTTFSNTSKEYKQSSYAWDFGDGASSSEKNPIHNYSKAGTYKVKLIITDPTACNEGDTIIQEVKVSEIKFFVSATTQQDTVYRKLSTQLQALPNSPDYIYQWTPEAGLSNPNISNPIATPDTSTLYTVTVTDPMSTCSNKANVRVTVIDLICDEPYIFIPNAFTPNDDLKNDKFFIKGEVFDKFNLMIYDRWGEKVFETEDKNKGWDGYFKGMKADPGVFVYYVEGTCLDQQKYKKKGNITLIR